MDTNLSYIELQSIAINAPTQAYHASPITPECKDRISKRFHIPIVIIDAYLKTEGAYPGHIRSNKNSSTNTIHSWDVGPMQINSIHWEGVYAMYGISPIDIRFNGCMNLMVGANIIRSRLDEAGEINNWDDFFTIAANYHSKTPSFNSEYKVKWKHHLENILEEINNGR